MRSERPGFDKIGLCLQNFPVRVEKFIGRRNKIDRKHKIRVGLRARLRRGFRVGRTTKPARIDKQMNRKYYRSTIVRDTVTRAYWQAKN